MTSGRIQKWGGKLLKVDGKVATHEDCCCGVGEDCEFCTVTPLQYSVTLTGVAAPWETVNDEVVLCDQQGDSCRFLGELAEPVHGGHYHYWVWPWANDTYRLAVYYLDEDTPPNETRIFLADGDIVGDKNCWDGFETPIANTDPPGGNGAVVRV